MLPFPANCAMFPQLGRISVASRFIFDQIVPNRQRPRQMEGAEEGGGDRGRAGDR